MTARLGLLGLLLAVSLALAPFAGGLPAGDAGDFVLVQLRLPRVLVGALVGCTLALAGASFQTIFRNPLATPSTAGTTAGAALGALSAFAFGVGQEHPWGLVGFAFLGAALASALTGAAAARGRLRDDDVLLVGIAVTLAVSALTTGLQAAADEGALAAAARWSLGRLPQVGFEGVLLLAPLVALSAAVQLAHARPLTALLLGEERASSQGVAVSRVRVLVLGGAALGVAAAVAWCGPIAFVGLLVPNAVRLGFGGAPRLLLPASALAGASFLVGCDLLARLALPGRELPVGVITAALGAPALVALIVRRRR